MKRLIMFKVGSIVVSWQDQKTYRVEEIDETEGTVLLSPFGQVVPKSDWQTLAISAVEPITTLPG
jgi:hypothetical protein